MKSHKTISDYGQQIAEVNHIGDIILEVQRAKRLKGSDVVDLSSGSPRVFPEVAAAVSKAMTKLSTKEDIANAFCQYGEIFIHSKLEQQLKALLGYGDNQSAMVTSGAISAIFYALNLFGGVVGKEKKKVLLPQSPEFPGYFTLGLPKECYVSLKPTIQYTTDHHFRYQVDIDQINFSEIGLVLLSRPCNPSGYIMPDEQLARLIKEAKKHDVVVVVDSAYSSPFPDLNYGEMPLNPIYDSNVLNIYSFAKAGLPGSRVGIVIGDEILMEKMRMFQSNYCLTTTNFEQMLVSDLLDGNELIQLNQHIIKPYYHDRIKMVHSLLKEYLSPDIPFYLHEPDGGMFAWLWLRDLPVSSNRLNALLKSKGVFIAPGSIFFQGLDGQRSAHQDQCVRLSVSSDFIQITKGIEMFCNTINGLYAGSKVSGF